MPLLNLYIYTNFKKSIKAACLSLAMLSLVACQSGSLSDGLQSVNANDTQTQSTPSQTQAQSPNQFSNPAQNGTQTASLPTTKAVAFLPVANAPQSAVTSLSRSIRNAASTSQVRIVNSTRDGAKYQVKGYFSALEDGGGTLLVYVWDVLDTTNKRVFRISGQERSSSKSADPWSSVTNVMLDRVAQTSLSQLKSWLTSKG
ncbi:MAG: hypothetical protein AB8B49_05435 [Nitratireductor sp.]